VEIEFIDLAAQQRRIRQRLDDRIGAVLDAGRYIMGPEVKELEGELARFCGARHAVTCANGTDALQLALMALNVGPGDAVCVPSFTFAATAETLPFLGAVPVFADIDPATYNLNPKSLERAIRHARDLGLRPAAVIAVDLFGLPADYDAIAEITQNEGMVLIADSAQGFGGRYKGRMTGTLGQITTTSFFPAKPLGCYGDGGALFTDNEDLAHLIDSYRVHGRGREKYDNVRIGMNSRLDTLQAAILLEKLAIYPEEIEKRQVVAEAYTSALAQHFTVPFVPADCRSIWAQYTLRLDGSQSRKAIQAGLAKRGIPSAIYYPAPLHQQTAYRDFPRDPEGLEASECAAESVLSVPMHPYLDADTQDRIIQALIEVAH
jgi:dTDP-4-amino-4,6-dideoxygalactose transaminase